MHCGAFVAWPPRAKCALTGVAMLGNYAYFWWQLQIATHCCCCGYLPQKCSTLGNRSMPRHISNVRAEWSDYCFLFTLFALVFCLSPFSNEFLHLCCLKIAKLLCAWLSTRVCVWMRICAHLKLVCGLLIVCLTFHFLIFILPLKSLTLPQL